MKLHSLLSESAKTLLHLCESVFVLCIFCYNEIAAVTGEYRATVAPLIDTQMIRFIGEWGSTPLLSAAHKKFSFQRRIFCFTFPRSPFASRTIVWKRFPLSRSSTQTF